MEELEKEALLEREESVYPEDDTDSEGEKLPEDVD